MTLTVFADLTVAVGVGMVLAALLFIHRVAETTTVTAVTDEYVARDTRTACRARRSRRTSRSSGSMARSCSEPPTSCASSPSTSTCCRTIVILRLRNMTALDGTGLHAIEQLADAMHASGRHLLLCGARRQPATVMARAGFHEHVGDANICAHVEDALRRARELHAMTQQEVG